MSIEEKLLLSVNLIKLNTEVMEKQNKEIERLQQESKQLKSKLDKIEEHLLKANVNSLIGGHKDKLLSIIKGDDNK
jgi:DNA-binding protein H-NS